MTDAVQREIPVVTWRKSSYSGKEGNCVEVAYLPGGATALRDSHDPDGPRLTCAARRLTEFLAATRNGDFSA